MRKTRVLVVDDAVAVRHLLTEILETDPQIEVIGTAANGQIALQMVEEFQPDVVTLDIDMPVMDGLDCLTLLRQRGWKNPIVICSTLTERGAAITLEALFRGADDYVFKPTRTKSSTEAKVDIAQNLIPKVKALASRWFAAQQYSVIHKRAAAALSNMSPEPAGQHPIEIVGIGLSTGGPSALHEILPLLPGNFAAPIVVVQHMPPMFTRQLAYRLQARSKLRIEEAVNGQRLGPGQVWLAPGEQHLEVAYDAIGPVLRLSQRPPEHGCRPSVDVLFRSLATTFGPRSLGIILTGMGQDGVAGCQAIHHAGGQVWIEDQSTATVWGMPGAVCRAGVANRLLPLHRFAAELYDRVHARRPELIGS